MVLAQSGDEVSVLDVLAPLPGVERLASESPADNALISIIANTHKKKRYSNPPLRKNLPNPLTSRQVRQKPKAFAGSLGSPALNQRHFLPTV